jgi:hypothetical protein
MLETMIIFNDGGLQQVTLSLVSTTVELLGRMRSGSSLET